MIQLWSECSVADTGGHWLTAPCDRHDCFAYSACGDACDHGEYHRRLAPASAALWLHHSPSDGLRWLHTHRNCSNPTTISARATGQTHALCGWAKTRAAGRMAYNSCDVLRGARAWITDHNVGAHTFLGAGGGGALHEPPTMMALHRCQGPPGRQIMAVACAGPTPSVVFRAGADDVCARIHTMPNDDVKCLLANPGVRRARGAANRESVNSEATTHGVRHSALHNTRKARSCATQAEWHSAAPMQPLSIRR